MKSPANYLSKWGKLTFREKYTFLKAAVCLLLIKTGLVLLPFSAFRQVFHWFSKPRTKREMPQQTIKEIVWAVDSAADHLPFQLLCLPRALAAKYLLRNIPNLTLEIGVEINPAKAFEAHAWLEKNGTVIIGDWPDSVSYQRLWVWE